MDEVDSLLSVCSHRYLRSLIDDTRNMSGAQIFPDDSLYVFDQAGRKVLSLLHFQEQHHRLIAVRLAPPPDAKCILDLGWEVLDQHVVNLGTAKTDTTWLQYTWRTWSALNETA